MWGRGALHTLLRGRRPPLPLPLASSRRATLRPCGPCGHPGNSVCGPNSSSLVQKRHLSRGTAAPTSISFHGAAPPRSMRANAHHFVSLAARGLGQMVAHLFFPTPGTRRVVRAPLQRRPSHRWRIHNRCKGGKAQSLWEWRTHRRGVPLRFRAQSPPRRRACWQTQFGAPEARWPSRAVVGGLGPCRCAPAG